MCRSSIRRTGAVLERFEPRQLLSAEIRPETEPNNTQPTATAVDMRTIGAVGLSGIAQGTADRDYFRIKVAANARLQVVINNLNDFAVKLRISDAFGTVLADTSKKASVYLDGGRSYFLKVQSKTASAAQYQIDLARFTTEVSKQRLDRLSRGVNLPEWFWNISGDVRTNMREYITASDVSLIKSLDFKHVRLPVDMKYYFNNFDHTTLDTTYLGELKSAILMFQSAGIATIICPFGDHQDWLSAGGDARVAALDFTGALARYLKGFNPELTFIQTTNEPPGVGASWQPIQAQVVSVIRSAAPRNTIITATPLYYGDGAFGTTGAINELATYRDTNVVYGLHFYEPFVFTHQGASWAIPGMEFINELRFPADLSQTESLSENLRGQYTGTSFEPIIDLVKYYGIDGWNSSTIQSRLSQAMSWAARNGVPMILDEFGVYGANVDDGSRYNYLSAVRTASERAGTGWTMWDYNSEFGIVEETENGRTLRYDVLAALSIDAP